MRRNAGVKGIIKLIAISNELSAAPSPLSFQPTAPFAIPFDMLQEILADV